MFSEDEMFSSLFSSDRILDHVAFDLMLREYGILPSVTESHAIDIQKLNFRRKYKLRVVTLQLGS